MKLYVQKSPDEIDVEDNEKRTSEFEENSEVFIKLLLKSSNNYRCNK